MANKKTLNHALVFAGTETFRTVLKYNAHPEPGYWDLFPDSAEQNIEITHCRDVYVVKKKPRFYFEHWTKEEGHRACSTLLEERVELKTTLGGQPGKDLESEDRVLYPFVLGPDVDIIAELSKEFTYEGAAPGNTNSVRVKNVLGKVSVSQEDLKTALENYKIPKSWQFVLSDDWGNVFAYVGSLSQIWPKAEG